MVSLSVPLLIYDLSYTYKLVGKNIYFFFVFVSYKCWLHVCTIFLTWWTNHMISHFSQHSMSSHAKIPIWLYFGAHSTHIQMKLHIKMMFEKKLMKYDNWPRLTETDLSFLGYRITHVTASMWGTHHDKRWYIILRLQVYDDLMPCLMIVVVEMLEPFKKAQWIQLKSCSHWLQTAKVWFMYI